MSVRKLDIFDPQGFARNYELWRLYALFCTPADGRAVVKIGVSSIVYDRILALRPGLSYPIGVVLHTPVGERGLTMFVEAAIHRAFARRRTRGEWFEFDTSSLADKAEFHSTVKQVYKQHVDRELEWSKVYPEQITAYADLTGKMSRNSAARGVVARGV